MLAQTVSDTLASKNQVFLEHQRWLFLNTKSRARIFLTCGGFYIFFIGLWFVLDGNARFIASLKSKIYSSVEIHKGFYDTDPSDFNVLLLGGSTTRELTSSNSAISNTLSDLCGTAVQFINAGSSTQSYIASRSIYDFFSAKDLNLIIVGANLKRYILSENMIAKQTLFNNLSIPISTEIFLEQSDYALNPPAFSPIYIGAYVLNKKSRFSKVSFNKIYKPLDESVDGIGLNNKYRSPPKNLIQKENIARKFLLSQYNDFHKHSRLGQYNWNLFADKVHLSGGQMVFVDLPISPSFKHTFSYFEPRYSEILESHIKFGANVVHWNTEELGIVESDFYDQQHYLATAREKIEPELIKLIQSKIPGCELQ